MQRSFTDTWRKQTSEGPQMSTRWQVRQPLGCSAMSICITERRSSFTSGVSLQMVIPSAAGRVQAAGKPRPPSTATTHIRQAAKGFIPE